MSNNHFNNCHDFFSLAWIENAQVILLGCTWPFQQGIHRCKNEREMQKKKKSGKDKIQEKKKTIVEAINE